MQIPNTTQTPNTILDNLPSFGDVELRILLTIVRKTLGWIEDKNSKMRKKEDWISSKLLERLTGKSRKYFSPAIQELLDKDLIEVRNDDGELLDTPEKRKEAGRKRQNFNFRLKTACVKRTQVLGSKGSDNLSQKDAVQKKPFTKDTTETENPVKSETRKKVRSSLKKQGVI